MGQGVMDSVIIVEVRSSLYKELRAFFEKNILVYNLCMHANIVRSQGFFDFVGISGRFVFSDHNLSS